MTAFYDLLWIGTLILMYLAPGIVAYLRHHNPGGVLIVNLILGWTVIGWIIALVMACGPNHQTVTVEKPQ